MKNKINKFIKLSIVIWSLAPFVLLAAEPVKDLGEFIQIITNIIARSVIPLIFTLAFAFFVWGVVQYVLNDADEAKKEKGKSFMVWGVIALTVMFTVFGLVKVLGDTFRLDTKFIPQLPEKK